MDAPFRLDRGDLEIGMAGDRLTLVDRIFGQVSAAIQARRLKVGSRMPSVRQLADDCDISRDTAVRAYEKLVAHGLLEARRGSGYFVKSRGPRKMSDTNRSRAIPYHSQVVDKAFRYRMTLINPPEGLRTRSGAGYLPGGWMEDCGVAGALRAVVRAPLANLDRPGEPQGYQPLREMLAWKLHDLGIRADAANIVVTTGATDALNLVVRYLLYAGDAAVIEEPCQPMLTSSLTACGVELLTVPRLSDGPDIDALRSLCIRHKPRVFFCNSLVQNPTSTHLAPHVAFQLLRLAEEFDFIIVEDDTYGDLIGPSTMGHARLAALDRLERVIFLGSFSKTLPPSLRVGYLAAHPKFVEWFCVYRAINCIASNQIAEQAVCKLLSEGAYRHHCDQLGLRLGEVRPRAIEALDALGIEVEGEPDAGFHLWANLGEGVDALAVATVMLEQGHLMAAGSLFSGNHGSYMRFNVAEVLRNDLLSTLKDVLATAMQKK